MDNEVRFERFLCPGKRLKSFSKLILSSKIIQIILTYAKFRFVHPSSYKPIGILSIEFWHDGLAGWTSAQAERTIHRPKYTSR